MSAVASSTSTAASAPAGRRPVGRPRQYDDDVERELLLTAAYSSLREIGPDFTVANVLEGAGGVSTRAFYRHFDSKDALLCAMYRRDAQWAARRLEQRMADISSPLAAVEAWVDEIFSFVRNPRRADRVAVLGSLAARRSAGIDVEEAAGRDALVAPLGAAIEEGVADGSFTSADPALDADLLAAAVMHAAGLAPPGRPGARHDRAEVVAFCLRALGAGTPR